MVKHLVEIDDEWMRTCHPFLNHNKAMNVIAAKLFQECGLDLRATALWVGSGEMGFGVVFLDDSITPKKRTAEDAEKLKNLEKRSVEMGISEQGGPKFERLCSALCRGYHDEPAKMARKPPPPGWDRDSRLLLLMQELRKKRGNGKGRCVPSDPFDRPSHSTDIDVSETKEEVIESEQR